MRASQDVMASAVLGGIAGISVEAAERAWAVMQRDMEAAVDSAKSAPGEPCSLMAGSARAVQS